MTEIQSTGRNKGRHVQPQGFVPAQLARPALRGRHLADERLSEDRKAELTAAADDLAITGLGIVTGVITPAQAGTVLNRAVRAMRNAAGVTAVLALAVAGFVASPATPAQAATMSAGVVAMEGPEPDSVVASRTVQLVLDRAYVTATVRVHNPRQYGCFSVWGPKAYGQGFLGRACGVGAQITVKARMDARYVPVGTSRLAVTDDIAPLEVTPASVILTARRPSKFGVGTWTRTQFGDGLIVSAPLYAWTPKVGRWTPQQASPVLIQELVRGRWVTRVTMKTNRHGVAIGQIFPGSGVRTLRVARPVGATVTAVTGTARTFELCPADVPDDTI